MGGADSAARRVRFYRVGDLATYSQIEDAADIAKRFDPADVPASTMDVLELHNVQKYAEAGFFPHSYTDAERAEAEARIPQIRGAVAKFFAAIDDTNVSASLVGVDYTYHADLLELLGWNKAFERCDAGIMLPALTAAGVNLAKMLASKKLVQAYDTQVRDALMGDTRNAEHLVRKYLQKDVRSETHLPRSFASADAHELFSNYLDSADANPNFVELIETAPVNNQMGVDAKLKLKAKRRRERMVEEFFKDNAGIKTGCEVRISDSQDEPVKEELDGMVATFTYSSNWLDRTTDNPSILNNFQHLFDFSDRHVLLTLPSFQAELGVFERFLTTSGRTAYHIGAAFRAKDLNSLLQTRLYHHYLTSKDIDLESVIAWFFDTYLVEEFGALNFSFAPSARASSYLEKARHLFAEMEGLVNQFKLYVQNGELDRDLLALTSDPVAYGRIPSMLDGKYVYASDGKEIGSVLHTLFSDQSGLTYINEALNARSTAQLLVQNQVSYTDFEDYQKPSVDHLIKLGVLEDTGTRVQIANTDQFLVLRSLFATQAATYHHLSPAGRAQVDSMAARGWVTRRASLLSEAEASYFNYYLNKAEFSNGPELRNKYLHGSQATADGEDEHFRTYITALRLIIALVIKLNDDFCLAAAEDEAIS
jgi:hypothetical protein